MFCFWLLLREFYVMALQIHLMLNAEDILVKVRINSIPLIFTIFARACHFQSPPSIPEATAIAITLAMSWKPCLSMRVSLAGIQNEG
jgi:hypothetical protein